MKKRKRKILKTFYINEVEDELIKLQMEKSNRGNFSDYARELLLNGEIKVVDFKLLKELIFEINRIGNNINQIIKKVHENRNVNQEDLDKIIKEQEELRNIILKKVNSTMKK